jgi:hypothetical protein
VLSPAFVALGQVNAVDRPGPPGSFSALSVLRSKYYLHGARVCVSAQGA